MKRGMRPNHLSLLQRLVPMILIVTHRTPKFPNHTAAPQVGREDQKISFEAKQVFLDGFEPPIFT